MFASARKRPGHTQVYEFRTRRGPKDYTPNKFPRWGALSLERQTWFPARAPAACARPGSPLRVHRIHSLKLLPASRSLLRKQSRFRASRRVSRIAVRASVRARLGRLQPQGHLPAAVQLSESENERGYEPANIDAFAADSSCTLLAHIQRSATRIPSGGRITHSLAGSLTLYSGPAST